MALTYQLARFRSVVLFHVVAALETWCSRSIRLAQQALVLAFLWARRRMARFSARACSGMVALSYRPGSLGCAGALSPLGSLPRVWRSLRIWIAHEIWCSLRIVASSNWLVLTSSLGRSSTMALSSCQGSQARVLSSFRGSRSQSLVHSFRRARSQYRVLSARQGSLNSMADPAFVPRTASRCRPWCSPR